MILSEHFKRIINTIARLPGIGPRQATRLAFYLAHLDGDEVKKLSADIAHLADIKICSDCFFVHENPGALCDICSNPDRDKSIIAIVEKDTDVISLEKTRHFFGRYLVLGDLRKDGILSDEKRHRLSKLKAHINTKLSGQAKEIIIATNPTAFGDLSASALSSELIGLSQRLTRLGRGLPTGGEIEFADEATLSASLDNRH